MTPDDPDNGKIKEAVSILQQRLDMFNKLNKVTGYYYLIPGSGSLLYTQGQASELKDIAQQCLTHFYIFNSN